MTTSVIVQTRPNRYSSDDTRWQAVLARDPAAEGVFYYAVRSTGIYCRPTCPAVRPHRGNVEFFEQAEDAAHAGYRPCARCHPDAVSAQQRAVAHAKHLLETLEPEPTLSDLGLATGLSPFHLQRIFKRLVGLSPKQYALHLRSKRLKAGLKAGLDVTTAMVDAGHSSSSLYDPKADELGMSPKTYQRGGVGQTLRFTVTSSPLGRLLVAATERGLCAVRFGEDEALVAELRAEYPNAQLIKDDASLAPYSDAILAYLGGQAQQLSLPTDVSGTPFQQRVWDALREIPYGETRSYAQVAQMIGDPKAVRAVARACATNPVGLVIPCHRVVRTGGALSGYRWGVERKKALLQQEHAHNSFGG